MFPDSHYVDGFRAVLDWCGSVEIAGARTAGTYFTCEKHIPSIQCGILISHLHDVQVQVLQSSFHRLRLEGAERRKKKNT